MRHLWGSVGYVVSISFPYLTLLLYHIFYFLSMPELSSTDQKAGRGELPPCGSLLNRRTFLVPFLTLHIYYIMFLKKCQDPSERAGLKGSRGKIIKKNIYPPLLYHIFFILSRPDRLSAISRPFIGFSDKSP